MLKRMLTCKANHAERALNILEMTMKIEDGVQVGTRYFPHYLCVRLKQGPKVNTGFPNTHSVVLNHAIGSLPRESFVSQKEQHLLGKDQTMRNVQVCPHALRKHAQ